MPALEITNLHDNQIPNIAPIGSLVTPPPVSLEFDFIDLRPASGAGMNLADLLLGGRGVTILPPLP